MSNDGNKSHELTFDVTLPKQAFIANFSMEIEGKVYPGNVKEKQQARKDYLEARQLGHTGGPRHSNQFEVSVNIEAGHNVTFSLFYQELLRRRLGTYEHSVHIDNRADIKELSVEVFIQERTEIQNVRTPALRKDIINNAVDEGTNTMTIISQPTPSTAHVVYQPTPGQVKEAGGGWFVVQYDVTSESAGDMMVVDGYFVHYFVPPSDLPPLPLDIVFVLDMSGSMSGTPIKQLREAMSIILDDLRPTDRFSIILFDDRVQYWQNRLQEASPSKATAGIQNSELIVQKVTELNKGDDSKAMANIYGLAFGGGADYRLLKQVSAKNNGFARKIYEGADATLQVSGLYKEIATVVLRALSIEYHSSTSDQGGRDVVRVNNSTVTVCGFSALYGQADAVVAGKLDNMDLLQPGETAGLEVVVSGQGLDGQKVNLVLNENDITDLTLSGKGENPFWSVPRNLAKITERAWAYLTIQQLLEQKVAAAEDKTS
nr:hypothetical protein BaRGS_017861 [Batillaria attramentaria]